MRQTIEEKHKEENAKYTLAVVLTILMIAIIILIVCHFFGGASWYSIVTLEENINFCATIAMVAIYVIAGSVSFLFLVSLVASMLG